MKNKLTEVNTNNACQGSVISVDRLTKVYSSGIYGSIKSLIYPQKRKEIKALDSVTFSIKAGEILGVIGPNGAGKTTLLKILAGVLQQDDGDVFLLGNPICFAGKEIRKNIGYVSSDERSFFWRLSGRDNLEFFGRLYGLTQKQVRSRTEILLTSFDLERKADRFFGDYSAGMRKKMAIMRALLYEPPIFLFDEATNSLDNETSEMVKDIVRRYIKAEVNRAAVWCTHRYEEIPHICDNVISLNDGKITSSGRVADTLFSSGTGTYLLKTKPMNGQFASFCKSFKEKLQSIKTSECINEFLFNNINDEEFSKIVTLAVKDYGAYVMFAGYIEKENLEK